MFSYEEYYKLYNSRKENEYREAREKLEDMLRNMQPPKEKGFREKIFLFLKTQAELLARFAALEEKRSAEYLASAPLRELQEDQRLLYEDILPQNYGTSYANPAYASKLFKEDLGPYMAAVAAYFRKGAEDVMTHRRFLLLQRMKFFFALHYQMTHERVTVENVSAKLREQRLQELPLTLGFELLGGFDPQNRGLGRAASEAELDTPHYLYDVCGAYADENVLKLREFVLSLSDEETERIAEAFANAYRDSFTRERKDTRRKKTAGVVYPLGMERIVRAALPKIAEKTGFLPFVERVAGAEPNRQYEYDHRFDLAAVLDEGYVQQYREVFDALCEENRSLFAAYAGPAILSTFGEPRFSPGQGGPSLSFTDEQNALYGQLLDETERQLDELSQVQNQAYSLTAYPSPAIGADFEAVFRAMIEINTLYQSRYERAQSSLINALDRGSSVTVKGRGGNETDLCVALQPIRNPRRQTNFYNCLADFNVPLGEVFTSPQLAGTNGLLHAEEAYLRGLFYKDLKIRFENGYVTEYGCGNFEDAEEGRRYVRENLFLPNETLPMGEFAIGTNTAAYCMALDYGIADRLPVLIAEKCGPHFALGDTCYVGCEDQAVYNPDRKEIRARENEKTALRRDDPAQAYTHCHTDITLPYDAIERLSVNTDRGSQDLIRAGRFVLPGTDVLNEPMIRREMRLQQEAASAEAASAAMENAAGERTAGTDEPVPAEGKEE